MACIVIWGVDDALNIYISDGTSASDLVLD